MRWAGLEAEPRRPEASPEVGAAYERLRRLRRLGLYGLAVAMSVALGALAVAIVWLRDGEAIGIAGGVSGTVIGLIGATLGVRAANLRLRIHRLLDSEG